MIHYELVFLAFACLGDFSILGQPIRSVPESLRPAAAAAGVCRIRPEIERFPGRPAAIRRLRELGPGAAARLRFCRNWKCWERPADWRPTLFVDGQINGGL